MMLGISLASPCLVNNFQAAQVLMMQSKALEITPYGWASHVLNFQDPVFGRRPEEGEALPRLHTFSRRLIFLDLD